jgi:hypothetical protein
VHFVITAVTTIQVIDRLSITRSFAPASAANIIDGPSKSKLFGRKVDEQSSSFEFGRRQLFLFFVAAVL